MDVQGIGQYSRPWKQIVMFISRTRDPCEWTIPKIKLRGKQRQAWKHMMLLARASSPGSNVVPDAWEEEDARESPRPIGASGEHPHDEQNPYQLRSLAKACLTFCIALLDERMTHKEYHSPMVCALAVLGVKIDGWLGPDRYPPILSTVIKISRFMVIQDALETTDLVESEFSGEDSQPSSSNSDARSREVQQDCLWLVQDAMNRFMVRGSHSPMQWMLDLRTYGLKIHYNTTTEGCIDWVGEQIVYKNIQFTMAELRKMVEELTMKSRQMLFEKLMFVENEQDAPMIPWSALRDNPVNQEQGWNFIRDERNPWLVDGSRWLQDRIQSYPEIQRGFIRSGEQLRWNKPVIRAYMSRVVEFRQRLLVLFHIIGGQPARGPEILSVRHSNSSKGQHRNIFVEDELVVFVTRYHKGYHVFGSVKIIHRYIPRAVSELFVYYQWLVKPFQDLIEAEIWDRSTISPFMWPADPGGKEWTSQRFSQGLKEASRCGIGASIGIQAWRDIAIGISRRYLRQEHVFRPNENDEEGIAEEAEEIHDAQAAHTSHVAGQVYARGIMEMEGVVASRRQRFRATSVAWHRFLGFEEIEMGRGKRRRGPFETEAENVLFQRWKRMRGLNIHDEFRRMMNPQAEFRGIQSTAIQAIVRGESPVVMVMGTGGGKSMGFMLPAWCSKDGVSVVVVPLIALRQDMMIRCRGMGIPCREWSRGSIPHAARLVFVTPESAISEDFQTFINRLQATQQLDRIIIDECHVILNNQLDFRRKLQRMGELSRVGVQMVLMTATLPPSQEAELWNRMRWNGDQVQLFRAGTTRKNVAYRVVFIGAARDECNPIVEAIEQKMEQYPEGKIVIYCHSVRKSQDLAEHLGCAAYPPSCKGERGDFERVLRSRSIDGGDECVRDGDRCGKHSSGDAYGSTTHIVGLCAGERAGGTRWGKERGDHDAAGERRGRRGENGGGTTGRSDDSGGGVPTAGVGSAFRWAYGSGWMRGGRGGMWGLCRVRVWVAKGRGSREECGVEDGSRDVHRAEISTNGNTTAIPRTNPKRGEGGGEVTTAFERAGGAMSILSMGWDGGRRASVETVSSGRVRTKSRITRTDSRDDASSARDGGVWRLRSMFCATSMM